MTTATPPEVDSAPLVKYSVTDAAIAELRERFTGLTCNTPQEYEAVRLAISEVRELRVSVEKRRVELKADALEFGRKVDAEAKRITGALASIEDPLKEQKQAVDAEKERVKQAAIEARRLELEAQLRADREAEEAKLKAVRDAEEARLAEQRAAIEAERKALDEARAQADADDADRRKREDAERLAEAEKMRVEREAIEADRRAVQQERDRAERAEFERQATIKAEADAVEKVERDRVAALARQAEIAALLPDVEKVRVYVAAIRALSAPKVKSKKVSALLAGAAGGVNSIASDLETKVGEL